ncbi:MAG: septal ring lytic transglycosylase RlpA family protein [Spirochaetia bacterium]
MSRRLTTVVVFTAVVAFTAVATASACESVDAGTASWYGGRFQGRRTASGEIFDTNEFTAAHRTLPFGTVVEVTNTDNDESVEVRITDRGPFVQDRVIDLSRAAAVELEMLEDGVAEVSVCIVSEAERSRVTLQVGSYSMEANARRTRERLRDEGFSAVIREENGVHRLLVEDVAEHRVEGTREALEELGFPGAFVRR